MFDKKPRTSVVNGQEFLYMIKDPFIRQIECDTQFKWLLYIREKCLKFS